MSPKIQIIYIFKTVCLKAWELIKQLELEKPRSQGGEENRGEQIFCCPFSLGALLILGKGQKAENPSRLSSRQKVASGKHRNKQNFCLSPGATKTKLETLGAKIPERRER